MFKRIFLDANVLADLYDENRPFCRASRKTVTYLLEKEETELFTSCDIVTTIYYIFARKDRHKALDQIIRINQWCTAVEFGNKEISQSCRLMQENRSFKDLEDTIQYIMARKVDADLILSNDKDFASEGIERMTTENFCRRHHLL